MKNIVKSALLLLLGACIFTACDDDNDSNPVLSSPSTFKLNTPAYSASAIDLERSDSLAFTWSQPDYGGFPAACEYQLEVSLTGNFTKVYNDAAEDASENDDANYVILDANFNVCNGSISSDDLAEALQKLGKWTEDATVPVTPVYVRAQCHVPGSTTAATSPLVYSNVVKISTVPYYVQLGTTGPEVWYLIGACVGDGNWTNSADAIGVSMIPMYTIAGETYNKKGLGRIQYVGYLTTAGFKLVKEPGSWDNQWGQSDAGYVKNDGGSDNITVEADGYYTVTLNTATDELTVTPYEGTPSVYTQMGVSGDFNGWGFEAITPVSTYSGAVNHDWYYDISSDAATTLKFLTDSGWSVNWGSDEFPSGTGVQNGANIPVAAGSYRVVFNDITGSYTFIAK